MAAMMMATATIQLTSSPPASRPQSRSGLRRAHNSQTTTDNDRSVPRDRASLWVSPTQAALAFGSCLGLSGGKRQEPPLPRDRWSLPSWNSEGLGKRRGTNGPSLFPPVWHKWSVFSDCCDGPGRGGVRGNVVFQSTQYEVNTWQVNNANYKYKPVNTSRKQKVIIRWTKKGNVIKV